MFAENFLHIVILLYILLPSSSSVFLRINFLFFTGFPYLLFYCFLYFCLARDVFLTSNFILVQKVPACLNISQNQAPFVLYIDNTKLTPEFVQVEDTVIPVYTAWDI